MRLAFERAHRHCVSDSIRLFRYGSPPLINAEKDFYMGQFADIRPYNDAEVPAVLEDLLADKELLCAIASLKLGSWHRMFSWLINPLVRLLLRRQLKNVSTVDGFQHLVKRYMDGVVEATTTGFTVSGLDELDPVKPYLFMSNHRDISLDPAFVNFALYHNGHDTVRIAIGDNLLTKPFVSDLMRINKSFIVRRSAKGPRQILAAYKLLSSYIRHSIEEDCNPIWIAQREGRAKDGNDRTEPAIIKMLAMSQDKKSESFSDYINALHIVPVAISYELDPCDAAKAKELYETAVNGNYVKGEDEDVASIALGISGDKGRVHVSFGKPLAGTFDTPEQVAAAVDQQVIGNYHLHPTNFYAYKMLYGQYPDSDLLTVDLERVLAEDKKHEEHFVQRVNAIKAEYRDYMLQIYANSINQKLSG